MFFCLKKKYLRDLNSASVERFVCEVWRLMCLIPKKYKFMKKSGEYISPEVDVVMVAIECGFGGSNGDIEKTEIEGDVEW